ncbi:hypothetical protein [Mariniblastus fucicola]|uniref:hypothetical protein n=1 Tax=Mariniblastus fucicola TaxID=980251 RepID=UPI0012FCC694|nr:hypothetical protein [Mariniblastus fucicola]
MFWGIEDGGLRGDNLDGVDHMANGMHAELRTPSGEIIPANVTSWALQTRTAEPEKNNLFCMYAIHRDPESDPIDLRVTEFGDAALIMTNPDEFINRLADAARKTNRSIKADLVTYVPANYIGDVGLFAKTEPFRYQSEWRFAMEDGPGNPMTLNIGDISDISTLINSDELEEFVNEYRSGKLDANPTA